MWFQSEFKKEPQASS